MSRDEKDTELKNYAKEATQLFGNRTQEENEALDRIKTLGSPENLITPDSDDEPCNNSKKHPNLNKL